jgi:hypothetical protein
MTWRPATMEEVLSIVEQDLADCDNSQKSVFDQFRVKPYFAKIARNNQLEQVVVVARKNNEVIYWEDVEEGFNISPITADQHISEPGANQDELRLALNCWK